MMNINSAISDSSNKWLASDKWNMLPAFWVFSISHPIFCATKVGYKNLIFTLVIMGKPSHNIIRLDISVHDSQLFMQILQSRYDLFHYHAYFRILIQFNFCAIAFLLYPLCETHIHLLKNNV